MATTDFSALIQGLKKDLHSLPSCGTPSIHAGSMKKMPLLAQVLNEEDAEAASIVQSSSSHSPKKKTTKKMVRVIQFVRYGMIPCQFFLFFLILLACLRPSFLYYHETNSENRMRSHFSYWYLFCYSIFFAALFMGMIHLQIWILHSLLRP